MARIDLTSATLTSNETAAGAVAIANDADAAALRDAVVRAGAGAIAIPFPKFNDGRGFSLANVLRRQFRFTGKLHATGHVLPDQALHLLRAGFDSAEIADAAALPAWQAALARYSGNYQSALRNPVALRREAHRDTIIARTISMRDRDHAALAAHAP